VSSAPIEATTEPSRERKTALVSAACTPSFKALVTEKAQSVGRSESGYVLWVLGKELGLFGEEE
jgi:hypothetical protein